MWSWCRDGNAGTGVLQVGQGEEEKLGGVGERVEREMEMWLSRIVLNQIDTNLLYFQSLEIFCLFQYFLMNP